MIRSVWSLTVFCFFFAILNTDEPVPCVFFSSSSLFYGIVSGCCELIPVGVSLSLRHLADEY